MLDLFTTASSIPCGLPVARSPSALNRRRLQRRHRQWAQQRTDRLFFAVVPDPETAARIGSVARHLRISHGLNGKPLEAGHFHVALCPIAEDFGPPPAELIEKLSERASRVVMPSFRVSFDYAMSFKNGALVLRGDENLIGLEVLQQRLSDALDGRPQPARRFTPHVTLLRDGYHVPEQVIEPIEWTVREMVLVQSPFGRTTPRHVVRIPLG
jgi:RNA 2',3'-cyclic 3'-phosphodiesterase